MQSSKGAIKFFAILLALVCIYQLSFTLVTKHVEKNAKEYANSEQVKALAKQLAKNNPANEKYFLDSLMAVKERHFLDSVASEPVYNILVKKFTYKECKERELNLGLDLKGGMNVTMEISVPDLVRAMSNNSQDPTFLKAMTKATEMHKTSQKDFITLFGEAFKSIDPNARLAAIFSTMDLKDRINFQTSNEDVLKVLRKEADDAMDRTYRILRTRIDKFGVTQPNIQKLQNTGRILIELPGIKEPERVRKLLQGTAKLEFWETYEYKELYDYVDKANKELKDILKGKKIQDTTSTAKDSTTASRDTSKSKNSILGKLESNKSKKTSAKEDTTESKSVNDFSKKNPLYAVLQPNLMQNEKGQYQPGKGPVVGYSALKDTGKVNAFLALPQIKNIFPKNIKFGWTVKAIDKAGKFLQLVALKVNSRDGSAALDGSVIVDARQDIGQNNSNEISMSMNNEGARIWKRLTGENIGKSIAIVLDGYVYSFPTVQNEIPNGRSSITGNFTLNEAKDLANILKAGKLPVPAKIVEEAVVGPSLGKEAINSGLMSFLIALLLVLVFMALYYNKAGRVADMALFANIFFLMGVLASIGAVLTLPGIAGIVLTIGMAVDANIIIYERVREELAEGKGINLALEDGYKNSYSAIIDSNVTTILTGIVLYIFGSGTIQGFATTLVIGILTSLFSALFISHIIFDWMLSRKKDITFDNNITRGAFKKVNFDFLGKKKIFYAISGTVFAIGIISMIVRGFSYGVDFTGGRTYVVRFEKEINASKLADLLRTNLESPEVKTFGSANQVKITTKYLINDASQASDGKVEAALKEGLKKVSDNKAEVLSSQKVGPTVAKDIIYSAFFAVFFALLIIFLYIFLRFKKWQWALGSIVALFHDTVFLLMWFSLFHGIFPFSLDVDQSFIAAILTVIGYSMNDTVIVFDRIREYLGIYKKKKMNIVELSNTAINATLSRTINTSLTIFFVLFTIFIFGGEVIRGFTFALWMGIIVGTYSSIFIATPIALDFIKDKES
ncbi:MAG: protein translocase subunit SecDF [Bacteroidota bacterium]|nr:protein translocase subunit SecDF [Bacteroidota bacterium]